MTNQKSNTNSELWQFLGETNSMSSQWINHADAKAGAVLVILALGSSEATRKAGALASAYLYDSIIGTLASILFWAMCICGSLAVLFVSLALFPRVKASKPSMAYFGAISSLNSIREYEKQLKSIDFNEELTRQNWEIAKIASSKYKNLKRAYVSVILFLVVYAISRFFLYWATQG